MFAARSNAGDSLPFVAFIVNLDFTDQINGKVFQCNLYIVVEKRLTVDTYSLDVFSVIDERLFLSVIDETRNATHQCFEVRTWWCLEVLGVDDGGVSF